MGKFGGGDGIYTQQFTCYVCGKKGYKNGSWLYRRPLGTKSIYFCGYGCMRKYDKAKEEEKAAKAAKRSEIQREKARIKSKRQRERRKLGNDKEGTTET